MSVQGLINERQELDSQINELLEVLNSHHVTMDTPLITPDGFPRADLDIPVIRQTRQEIIRLRNDLKDLMKRIEEGLHDYFKTANGQMNGHTTTVDDNPSRSGHTNTSTIPFAKVSTVSENGPAAQAGLHPGDQVIQFGSVNASNHSNLTGLATLVNQSDKVSKSFCNL